MVMEAIRSGSWLTRERLRAYPLILGIGLGAALCALVATRTGNLDHWGRPLGTDFSQIWVAGAEVLAGHPAQPYDNPAHAAAQAASFGPSDSFYSWPYPPYFLALAVLAACLPYLPALAAWQGTTLMLYLAAVLRAAKPPSGGRAVVVGTALAFPAVAINLMHGHNGFLTASLLTAGTLLLPRRPLLAGALFGLLAYKPQFALAVPVALLASGSWRAVAGATVSVLAATAATLLAFGTAPWPAFVHSLAFTRLVVLEAGAPGYPKMQSAFAAARLLGGSVPAAYAAQALVTGSALAALAWLWRGGADRRLKFAALLTASLLTTPYCMDYDLVVLGPALVALVSLGAERGFAPYGKSLLAWVWLMPLLARPAAAAIHVPIGVLTMAVLFWHIVGTARTGQRCLACGPHDTVSST